MVLSNHFNSYGLRWWHSEDDAIRMGRVYYVFGPEYYSLESLQKTNRLIKLCLDLWSIHGLVDEKDRKAVEILQRQYYNNQRRIYHFIHIYDKKIRDLSKQFARLKI